MLYMRTGLIMVLAFLAGVLQLGAPTVAFSELVIATETARAEWEDGKLTPFPGEFEFHLNLDEKNERAILVALRRLKTGDYIEQPVEYYIFSTDPGNTLASMFGVSPARKDQRILTLIGKPGSIATEIIQLGETYFEYCKVALGRLYLSSGKIRRSISMDEDSSKTLQRLLNRPERDLSEPR